MEEKLKNNILMHSCNVEAGFPSPAENYIEKELNLHDYLVRNPEATFLVRATGESMIDVGILPGDILVVDRSLDVSNNSIVIASVNGDLTVKKFIKKNESKCSYLKSENSKQQLIRLDKESDIEIWGIVIYSIHALR